MGLENVTVVFDNSLGLYLPGQTVRGNDLVQISNPQEIKSVYIVSDATDKVHFKKEILDNTFHYFESTNHFHQRIHLYPTG